MKAAGRIQIRSGAVFFNVRLTPRGGRDAIEGWQIASNGTSHLKARVRTAPESGKANAALAELIAITLGVSHSSVAIAGGEKTRLKTIVIAGDTSLLAAKLKNFGAAK